MLRVLGLPIHGLFIDAETRVELDHAYIGRSGKIDVTIAAGCPPDSRVLQVPVVLQYESTIALYYTATISVAYRDIYR